MQPGDGGVIGVSKDYEVVAEFNSQAMYRGWVADVQRVHDGCRGGGTDVLWDTGLPGRGGIYPEEEGVGDGWGGARARLDEEREGGRWRAVGTQG